MSDNFTIKLIRYQTFNRTVFHIELVKPNLYADHVKVVAIMFAPVVAIK